MVMTMNDDMVAKQLKELILRLEQRVSYLERENNRRKNEYNSLANVVKRS